MTEKVIRKNELEQKSSWSSDGRYEYIKKDII